MSSSRAHRRHACIFAFAVFTCAAFYRWSGRSVALLPTVAATPLDAIALKDLATDGNDPSNLQDSEPSVAINPRNPNEIAVVTFSENWGADAAHGGDLEKEVLAPIWKSSDGGNAWRKVRQIPAPKPNLQGPVDQRIAYSRQGRLLATVLGQAPKEAFLFRQTGGPDEKLTLGAEIGVRQADQPQFASDLAAGLPCGGRLYSIWLELDTGKTLNSSSMDDGATAGAESFSGDNTFPHRTSRVAVAPDGKAYLVYKTREGQVDSSFEKAHFRLNRSDNCGASWDALGGSKGVSVHGPGAVLTYYTESFGNPQKGRVVTANSSDVWVTSSPDSKPYVTYVSKDASDRAQIYLARSADSGASWVTTRVTDGAHNSAFPEVAVANDGSVGVLFVDYDDSGAKTIFRHHFARSSDLGAHWNDVILQPLDPSRLTNIAGAKRLWGDYEALTAFGNMFFGVFTGESIGRSKVQLDPIFFKAKSR